VGNQFNSLSNATETVSGPVCRQIVSRTIDGATRHKSGEPGLVA
jgi:hypothetical protein